MEDIGTSNQFKQLVFSFLYILSFISLLAKRHQIIPIIKREKFLSLFLFWLFLSLFWSDFFFVSLKRWVQLFGGVIIVLSALLHFRTSNEALHYFRDLFVIYIPLTFLSILFIPGAIEWEFPAWRGLAPSKNWLGQMSLISLIVWSYSVNDIEYRRKKFAFLLLALSFVLLIGSKGTTAFLTMSFLFFLLIVFYLEKILFRYVADRFIFFLLFFTFFSTLFLFFYFVPDTLASLFKLFGKDLTFTGRVDLWAYVFEETKEHIFLGTGYGGFWVVNSPALDILFEEFVWLPNQAHMGYLDILNESGVIGIFIFLFMVISYFKNLSSQEEPEFWKWFVIAALIFNITESTLFKLGGMTGDLFIFSYLALYVKFIRTD